MTLAHIMNFLQGLPWLQLLNITLTCLLMAHLNRSRGDGNTDRILFAFLAAFVLVGTEDIQHYFTITLCVWLGWVFGWGEYLGKIVAPNTRPRAKEELVTDFLMKPFAKLGDRAWGTLATSIRFTFWTAPLFIELENPLWLGMMAAGPIYLICTLVDEYLDRSATHEEAAEENGWELGEYAVAAWMTLLILLG